MPARTPKPSHPALSPPQALLRLRHEANAVMNGLLQGCRRVAVLSADNGPDLAQALATIGTLRLLATTGRTIVCAQTTAGYDPAAVIRKNPDCIVVVAGGMTGWTDEQLRLRRAIANDLHRTRIVMLAPNENSSRLLEQAGIKNAARPDLRLCCPVRQTPPFAGIQEENAPDRPFEITAWESTSGCVDIESAMRHLAPHPRIVTRDAGLSLLAWMMGKETTLVLPADADAAKALSAALPTATGLTMAGSEPAAPPVPFLVVHKTVDDLDQRAFGQFRPIHRE